MLEQITSKLYNCCYQATCYKLINIVDKYKIRITVEDSIILSNVFSSIAQLLEMLWKNFVLQGKTILAKILHHQLLQENSI